MSSDLLLTEWFGPDAPPVRVGVYEVDDEDGIDGRWFSYWDGRKFGFRAEDPAEAADCRHVHTDCARLVRWRGVRRWVVTSKSNFDPERVVYLVEHPSEVPCWRYELDDSVASFDSKEAATAYAEERRSDLYPYEVVLP